MGAAGSLTIEARAGSVVLSSKGVEFALAATPLDAKLTLETLRKCFREAEEDAVSLDIERYEAERARFLCAESLSAALNQGYPDSGICPEGHRLSAENSFQKSPGVKGCRSCRKESNFYWQRARGLV